MSRVQLYILDECNNHTSIQNAKFKFKIMELKSLSRLVYLAAGIFIAIWFAYEVIQVILLFFFAIVITIVLNAPTAWLERKKIRRTIAALIVFFAFLIFLTALGWLIIPKIVYQVQLLITDLPQ